jgi:hypothetical protein
MDEDVVEDKRWLASCQVSVGTVQFWERFRAPARRRELISASTNRLAEETVIRHLTFWCDGLNMGDGELRHHDYPV